MSILAALASPPDAPAAAAGTIGVGRIDGSGAAALPRAELIDLAARALDPNIFHDPDMLAAACGLSGPIDVFWLEDGAGRLMAALPVHRRAAGLGLAGCVPHGLTHVQGPSGTPALAPEAGPGDIARLLAAAAGEAGLLVLPYLATESETARRLVAAAQTVGARVEVVRQHARAAFHASPDAETEFDAHLTRRKRKEWGRLRRRLADLGPVTLDRAEAPEAVAIALSDFLLLEARGWKGHRSTALLNHQPSLDFAEQSVAALAARGGVRIDRLIVDGRSVAGLISFRSGGHLWTWKTAYDEDFARFSPGVLLMLALTETLVAESSGAEAGSAPAIHDADSLATADHPMIDTLWPWRRVFGTLVIDFGRKAFLGRLVTADIRLYDHARDVARRILRR